MKRQLPVIDIMGTPFCVDVQRDELWQQTDPVNRIPFSVFDQEGDGYTFLYDTLAKNSPERKEDVLELGGRYCWVTLPALMELDPEGIALKYGIPLSILCPGINSFTQNEEEDEIYGEELY